MLNPCFLKNLNKQQWFSMDKRGKTIDYKREKCCDL